MFYAGIQQFTGGRGFYNRYPSTAGYQHMKKLPICSRTAEPKQNCRAQSKATVS